MPGAGCGGKQESPTSQSRSAARDTQDPLHARAARVDSLLLVASGEANPDTLRDVAFHDVEILLRDAALERRPGAGWTLASFREAVAEYGLALRFESLGELKDPYLVLAHDPRNLDLPPRVWLFYAATGSAVQLPAEPFRQEFAPRGWRESGEALLGIVGWERARAGLQPKGWLFRLPADASRSLWEGKTLPPISSQFLSQGGASSARWLPATAAAPRLLVEGAALPNPLFDECGSCPHLEADLVYTVTLDQFVALSEVSRPTPYAAFVAFLEALLDGNAAVATAGAANPVVVEVARQHGFDRLPTRGRWRTAPGASATQLDQTYFRGEEGVYRVLMSVRDSSFVVSSITPTEFLID